MTTPHKLELIGAIVISVALVIAGRSWLDEHDARLKAESDAAATKAAFEKLQDDRTAAAAAEAERDRQTAAQNAATMSELAKTLKTPAAIADYTTRMLPGLPAPAIVTTPKPAPDAKPDAPAPKPLVTVDAATLDTRLAQCKVAETSLASCNADLADRAKDRAAADAQIKLLQNENSELVKLTGQSKWQKAWNGYIKPGLFAAGGAAAGYVAGRGVK